MDLNATRITNVLRGRYSNNKYNLANSFVFDWESDFFTMADSGYVYEIEVKLTRSDYHRDFKKPKHLLLKNPKFKINRYRKNLIPNRFYFCCPNDLVFPDEVPHYAGLIWTDGFSTKVVKPAPFIHKEKLNLNKILLDKFYYLYREFKLIVDMKQTEMKF